ncbi:UNVERIFIED_CONTAM: putative protein phosphatase 2C 59 [Sesamum radiatum]|uniref:PPM-type phosphatase domain-containing protein n=1 Tax=Sesamum radiatum TaxID=300843 RepID=A0AAW2JT98_SESRA
MKSVAACLKRQLLPVRSTILWNGNYGEAIRWRLMLLGGPKNLIRRVHDDVVLSRFLQPKFFSSGYSSVHGERPSAEYAKLRKESLESQFGRALGSRSVSILYRFGPFLALYRAAIISFHVLKLTIWRLFVHDIKKRSVKFRETLIQLGPFYVKLGQALSTRPDILPAVYCQELAKLQDRIPPFSTDVAIKSIESQLGMPIGEIFADISDEPIAAASLGQVYKAHLHSGELVAVKVQRPGMSYALTLDALLFNMIGGQLKRFAKARKDLLVAVNEMVRHMFEEIDYILEGQNAERFAALYGCRSFYLSFAVGFSCNTEAYSKDKTTAPRKVGGVKVPKIYWNLTRKGVLTMEWLDGIKLTDKIRLAEASLNRKQLIDELVHFVNRDSLGLANDFLSLGFIPEGVDIQSVSDALQASFGDGTRLSQDFQIVAISEQASGTNETTSEPQEDSNPLGWKSFNMRAVVAATEDLFQFILSRKGSRVRVFLIRDILKAADTFLEQEVVSCFSDEKVEGAKPESEGEAMLSRVVNGVQSLREAVMLAPDAWTAMTIRLALKPEFQKFAFDVVSALFAHSRHKLPDTLWLEDDDIRGVGLENSVIGIEVSSYGCDGVLFTTSLNNKHIPVLGYEDFLTKKKRRIGWDMFKHLASCFLLFLPLEHVVYAFQNGKFTYGYASSQGKRSSMEDYYDTRIDGVDGEMRFRIMFLALNVSGHGGAQAAEYVKRNLFSNLVRHPKFLSDIKSAIGMSLVMPGLMYSRCIVQLAFQPTILLLTVVILSVDTFSHTDSEFLKNESNQNKDAGSTASTAILLGDRLLVANVGDSRAVICRGGDAIAVSRDHKPNHSDERQRIENAGGFVMWAGTWRVGGVLAVSRAFGDKLLKRYVVSDPEIQEEKVDGTLEFLILASDGLWDVVTNEEAVSMIKPIPEPEEAARRLLQEAHERGSADNITVVVVRFVTDEEESSNTPIREPQSASQLHEEGQT